MVFELPKLKYAYNALEPHFDARTMEIHHSKHHAGYTNNFNKALEGVESHAESAEEIIAHLDTIPEKNRLAIKNNGGGYVNHKLFWEVIGPNAGGLPKGELLEAIEKEFGSFDEFKEKFSNAAKTQFGSGWAWLVVNKNKELEVVSTANQDSPLSEGKTPILCLDVWEHSYYKKFGPDRAGYIDAWWNLVDWEQVEKNIEAI